MRKTLSVGLCAWAIAMVASAVMSAQSAPPSPVQYDAEGKLRRPADYREWIYLTSGLGMTYGPARNDAAPGNFDNVFVTREAYREFMATGKWPDKTMFILEIRNPEQHVSINNGGQTQGAIVAIEAAVKDQARFPDAWGYFTFGTAPNLAAAAAPLPATASCYACHKANTAVEQTFVQFYPTLMDVARQKGTVKPTYVDHR
jgi:hypothetical protein